jgi:hypothetical protein
VLGEVIYLVDSLDRIGWVSENWDRFASANESPELCGSTVIGTELWSHVSDLTLRHLLQRIFAKARASRGPLFLTCRCDAPNLRRDLEVRVESSDGASVCVTSTVTSEVPRPVTLASTSSDVFVRLCSWCNAIDVAGNWVELETAVEKLGLLLGPHYPQITHALCRKCEDVLRAAAKP